MPNLSSSLEPLHMLLKKDVPWTWTDTQQLAFDAVQKLITNTPVLAYYDPHKELVLENDASEYGLDQQCFRVADP